MNPNNNKVRFRLSELYESQGKIKEALEILEISQKRIKAEETVKEDDQQSIVQEPNEIKIEQGETPVINRADPNAPRLIDLSSYDNSSLLPLFNSLSSPEAKEFSQQVQASLYDSIKECQQLNPKTKRRMENLIDQNLLYFVNLNRKIKNTLTRSNFDKLLLEFRRCEINLKNDLNDFYSSSRDSILNSLKLEIHKKKLYSQIYSNLLRENKGKIHSFEK
jgi:hypothetical protein